jgi:hypothetical protein
METIKEMVEHQDTYGVTLGEDGGVMIQTLKELAYNKKEGLTETKYVDLGTVKHMPEYNQDPECGSSRLELYIFENKEYKFICIEDTEVYVSAGGTCYSGSVEIYRKGEE